MFDKSVNAYKASTPYSKVQLLIISSQKSLNILETYLCEYTPK